MTGILPHDWLGPALEHEISDGLEWRKEKPESKAKIRHSQALEEMYSDDGSNLRFKYEPSDSSPVQVLDLTIYPDKRYVDATVSDGHTSVKTVFASTYVAGFQKTSGRDFTKHMKGAIFDLKEFEIVVDYSGACVADTVQIRILDAVYRGSSGSPIFGKPTSINKRHKIQMLVEQLQDPPGEELASQFGGSQSQTSWDDRHFQETQFATQVPGPSTPISGSLRPKKKRMSTNHSGPQDTTKLGRASVATGSNDHSALLGHLKHSTRSIRQHEPENQNRTSRQSPTVIEIKKEFTGPSQSEPRLVDGEVESDSRMDFDGPETGADVPVTFAESQSHFQKNRAKESAASGAEMQAKLNNQSINPLSTFRERPLDIHERVAHEAQVLAMMEADDAPTSFQAPPPEIHSSALPNSSAATTVTPFGGENRIGGSQLQSPSLPSSNSAALQSSGSNARSATSQDANKKPVSDSGPWKGTLSISRAISCVTQEQEDILSKSESWLPPAPGKTFPLGNVPGPILALLGERAERAAKGQHSQEPSEHNALAVEHHNPKTNPAEVLNREENDAEDEDFPRSSMDRLSAVSWPTSPEYPFKRWADVGNPPDSSGHQSSGRPSKNMAVLDVPPSSAQSGVVGASTNRSRLIREQTEDAHNQENTNMPSSPPESRPHFPTGSHGREHNGEDDLEMSAPKALPASNPQLSQTSRRTSSAAAISLEEVYASEAEEAPFAAEEPPASVPRSFNRSFMARHDKSSSHPQPPGPGRSRPEKPLRSSHTHQQVSANEEGFHFDGVADSQPSSDNEDILIERQIQNEIESQAFLQSKRNTIRSGDERRTLQSHERTQDANLQNGHIGSERSTKRAQPSPSPERSSKRPRSVRAEYGFSQESVQLENPKYQLMEQRKEHKRSYRQRKTASAEDANKAPSPLSNQTENVDVGPAVAMDAQTRENLSLSHTESHEPPAGQQQESGHEVPQGSSLNQTSVSTLSNPPAQSLASHVSDMPRDEVFAHFKAAYPEYGGDRTRFIRICRKIHELPKGFHHTFWDDFVIRHLTDFGLYQSKCRDDVTESLSYNDYYFKFFYQEVDEPKSNKRILTPSTLNRVFEQETQSERACQQQRVRSRSPVTEERRTGDNSRPSSSAYRTRSPLSSRSVNPTTSRTRSPSRRESLPARPQDSERKDSFAIIERRDISANGGSIANDGEKSPSSSRFTGPASTTYGSPTRREPMTSRWRDSDRTPRFRGDSYRPSPRHLAEAGSQTNSLHASPSHDSLEKFPQQHQDLVIRDSPSRRAQQDLSPRGPSSAQSTPQKAVTTPRSSTSQAPQIEPSVPGLSAPGPSKPSAALDQTNAKPGPSVNEVLRKDNKPASANAKTEKPAPITARRGGRGGRGRGGFSNPREVWRGDRFYAVDNLSTAPDSMTGPSGGNAITPPKVRTEKSTTLDLTKSSPATIPSTNTASREGSRGRGQGGIASKGSGRGRDATPAPPTKTAKPTTAPAANMPKKSNGRSGPAGGAAERGRSGFSHSREAVDPRRGGGGGGGSNPATASLSRTAPSTPVSNTTKPGATPRTTPSVDASSITIQAKNSAPPRYLDPPPPASASRTTSTSSARAGTAASPTSSEGSAKKSGTKKGLNPLTVWRQNHAKEEKRRSLQGGGGSGDGAGGSPADTK